MEKTEFHKLDDKLRVLINIFVQDFDYKSDAWSHLMEFKKFRDALVHPRLDEDSRALSDYENRLKRGISGVIQIMNCLSKGMFQKPLRKQLLDLVPD